MTENPPKVWNPTNRVGAKENLQIAMAARDILSEAPLLESDRRLKEFGDHRFEMKRGGLALISATKTPDKISMRELFNQPDTIMLTFPAFPAANYSKKNTKYGKKASGIEKMEAMDEWGNITRNLLYSLSDLKVPLEHFALGTLQENAGGISGALGYTTPVMPVLIIKKGAYQIAMREAFGKLLEPSSGAKLLGLPSVAHYYDALQPDAETQVKDIVHNVLLQTNYNDKELEGLQRSASDPSRENYTIASLIQRRIQEILSHSTAAEVRPHGGGNVR